MERPGTYDQHDTLVLGPSGQARGNGADPAPWAPAPPPRWTAPVAGAGWAALPPPPVGPPTVVLGRNNAAVIGATLGSVSLFLSAIPLIGLAAWLLAPLGVVCSVIGLAVGMSRRVGRIGALWGLVTSGMALAICVAWVALVLAL